MSRQVSTRALIGRDERSRPPFPRALTRTLHPSLRRARIADGHRAPRGARRTRSPVPLAGYTPLGRTPETLCLYRLRSLNPLFWVRREGAATTYAPILSGTLNDPPPAAKPANFPGATTVQLSGVVSGRLPAPRLTLCSSAFGTLQPAGAALEHLGAILYDMALECSRRWPEWRESATRAEMRAVARDLQHAAAFLQSVADERQCFPGLRLRTLDLRRRGQSESKRSAMASRTCSGRSTTGKGTGYGCLVHRPRRCPAVCPLEAGRRSGRLLFGRRVACRGG